MIKETLIQGNLNDLATQLRDQPELANQTISIGPSGKYRVHPLHFVCDAVFEGDLLETVALELTKVLLEQGATINGQSTGTTTKDSPLIAASSLYCEKIAIYLIGQGADLMHRGTHKGTCLHWAAWTGSDQIVERLLQESISLDDQEDEFQSTPLLWAVNGWLHPKERNHRNQPKVMTLLLETGADLSLVDGNGQSALEILSRENQFELVELLSKY